MWKRKECRQENAEKQKITKKTNNRSYIEKNENEVSRKRIGKKLCIEKEGKMGKIMNVDKDSKSYKRESVKGGKNRKR